MNLDLHIHSEHSLDCLSKPKDISSFAFRKGLGAIAITDHDTTKGSKAMKKFLSTSKYKNKLKLIPGIEINTNIGDVVCLFIEDDIRSREINEVMDSVLELDGIAILAHPYVSHKFKKDDLFLNKLHGVETFNARTNTKANMKAKELADKLNKAKIGASDAHWPINIGNGYTVIKGKDLSLEEIRRSIIKCKTRAKGIQTKQYFWHKSDLVRNYKNRNIAKIPGSLFGSIKYRFRND